MGFSMLFYVIFCSMVFLWFVQGFSGVFSCRRFCASIARVRGFYHFFF